MAVLRCGKKVKLKEFYNYFRNNLWYLLDIYAIAFLLFSLLFVPKISLAQNFTVKTIGDYGHVTVMEVTGDYDVKNLDDLLNSLPRQEIVKEFFKIHKDEYDFLVIFTNFDFQMSEGGVRAFYFGVKNDTLGIVLIIQSFLEVREGFKAL